MYVEKIRNQAYLENRLQNFQKYEETSQNSLKGIIERNKEGGKKIFSVVFTGSEENILLKKIKNKK